MSDTIFFRRKNPDSTINLICLNCYRTIRITDDDADFPLLELLHHCRARRFPPANEGTFHEKVLKFLGEREELFKLGSR